MRRCLLWHMPLGLVGAAALLLSSCEGGGQFTLFGYTTQPNYNCEIRTVRVPIFGNDSWYRDLEFQLTQAVIREIESKTPYKVVPGGSPADTELVGKITSLNKNVVLNDQLNGILDQETTLTVAVTWNDLRPGHIGDVLSMPATKPPGTELIAPPEPAKPAPAIVQSIATVIPQFGMSLASARQVMVDKLAVQIISMMEKPWGRPPCATPP